MTIANPVGVLGGTWLGHHFSWRYTFALIAVFNVAVFLAIFCWVPTLYDRASTRLREQFRFLASPAPWLIFAATMFGNAGVFAWFSYIKPFMLNVSGFAESKMMLIMMLAGLGMVVGNLFSGKISGRYSPLRIAAMTDGVIAVTLLLIFAFGEHKVASLALAFSLLRGTIRPVSAAADPAAAERQRRRDAGAAGDRSPLTSAAPSAPSAAE